jgi:hypothetical protein
MNISQLSKQVSLLYHNCIDRLQNRSTQMTYRRYSDGSFMVTLATAGIRIVVLVYPISTDCIVSNTKLDSCHTPRKTILHRQHNNNNDDDFVGMCLSFSECDASRRNVQCAMRALDLESMRMRNLGLGLRPAKKAKKHFSNPNILFFEIFSFSFLFAVCCELVTTRSVRLC